MAKRKTRSRNPDPRPALNASGQEIPDARPLDIPAGFAVPETMEQIVQRLVRTQVSAAAAGANLESFEESQDFDIPDDPVDPGTPFEEFFDPVLGRSITPHDFQKFEAAYRREYLKAQGAKHAKEDREAAIADRMEALKHKNRRHPAERQTDLEDHLPPGKPSGRQRRASGDPTDIPKVKQNTD